MAAMVAKFVGKKILGETLENNFGKEDPYFETVPATRIDGRSSHKKPKRRRKALPEGLSAHDGKVLTKVKRRAYRLDMSFGNCCGIKFGWSSVIGIIPVIGDVIDALLALMVVQTCRGVEGGLPSGVQMQMMFNIALDFGVGLMPLVGDMMDAVFKANTRNAVVLEKYLRQKGALALKAQGRQPQIDPSDPDEFDRQEDSDGPPPQYTSTPTSKQGAQSYGDNRRGPETQIDNRQPQQQQQQQQQLLPPPPVPKQGGSGWFGFGSKSKQPDSERGHDMGIQDERRRDDNQDTVGRNKSTLQKNRP